MKLQHFCRGYLEIRLIGICAERFLTLCGKKGIVLTDIRKGEEGITAGISLPDFYRLRPYARKTGVRIKIIRRYGLPFYKPWFRRKLGFFTGLFLMVLFWGYMSTVLWGTSFVGNYSVTDEMLRDFLNEQGVGPGKSLQGLSMEELEEELREKFPIVTWTCIRLDGNLLIVTVKENEKAFRRKDGESDAPSSLTAAHDGVVKSIVTRKGVPLVKPGDFVREGQVLVDGLLEIPRDDGSIRLQPVRADADIVLTYAFSYQETLQKEHYEKTYTGRVRTVYGLFIGGREWKWPFWEQKSFPYYEAWEQTYRFPLLTLQRFEKREYRMVACHYGDTEAKILLQKHLTDFFETLETKGVQIVEKDVKINNDGLSYHLDGHFTAERTEMQRNPILLETE